MPRSVQVYAWSLFTAGAAALLYFIPELSLGTILPTIGFAICAAIFERYLLILPNRVAFSLGAAFAFLAYAHQGLASALVVEAVAAAVNASRAKRWVQRAFNFGQLLLSLLIMHLVVSSLGKHAGVSAVGAAVILLLGGLSFFTANVGFVSGVFWLLTRRPLRLVVADVERETRYGVFGCLASLLPLLHTVRQGGWITLGLVCGILLAFRYAVNLYLEQKRIHLDSLAKLSSVLEQKTGAAESHATQVALLARTLAEELKLPPPDVETIHAAAILHDVGEAEVDPRVVSVMTRKAIPTLADLEAYRKHSLLGETLVSQMEGMGAVSRLIRSHHEAWNGSGYPDGLRGPAIPLGARILAAAEAVSEPALDVEGRLAAADRLLGSIIDPGLAGPLKAALVKTDRPEARAQAVAQEPEVSKLQSTVLEAVRQSSLLDVMGIGQMLRYDRESFTDFSGRPAVPLAKTEVGRLAEQCAQSRLPVREHVIQDGVAYDVYCLPDRDSGASVLVFDVTDALRVEREHSSRIFRAYRDVMRAATKGKLMLVDDEERLRLLAEGELRADVPLQSLADGETARAGVRDVAHGLGMISTDSFHLVVCASEAVTNVFKHAGKGKVSVRATTEYLRVIVSDSGGGIPYEILPQAVLTDGYSTQRSLGKGFSVLLRFMDRVWLHTGRQGTTIILEKRCMPAKAVTATDSSVAQD